MSADAEAHRDLRRRLFVELSRGADAELGKLLMAIGVVAEPPAHVDAHVLLESGGEGAQRLEPPPWIDKAILAAAEAAIRERTGVAAVPSRRRWRSARAVAVGTFAMAAAVLLGVGLTRLRVRERGLATQVPAADPADERVRIAIQNLTRDVLARDGREAAARVRDAEEPEGAGPHAPTPTWEELSRSPRLEEVDPSTAPLSPAEQERFAQGVLSAADRARLAAGVSVLPALRAMLERERGFCPKSSRCFGLLSLGLARFALDGGDLVHARAYADEALLVNDLEVRTGAREVIDEVARGDGHREK